VRRGFPAASPYELALARDFEALMNKVSNNTIVALFLAIGIFKLTEEAIFS